MIPKLAMGVLECRDLLPADVMDQFMNTLLRAVWRCLALQIDMELTKLLCRGYPVG